MVRICLFTTGFGFNRQTVLNYIEKILPNDAEAFLFTPENCNNKYYSKKIKIIKTTCSKYSSFFELRQFCIKNNIDRIINLGVLPQEGFVMAFASFFNKRNFICFQASDPVESFKISRGSYKIKSFFEALLFLPLILFPKKILFCSKDIYEVYKNHFFYFNKKLDYLPLAINTKLFSPKSKANSRKKLNLPLNKKIIIYIGRIEYLKGSDILIDLIKNNQDKYFVLIGEINDNKFKNLNLPNLVQLNSKKPQELLDYYNSADLCIFPSRIESFGFVPREAMACGIPTLVSDIKSLRTLEPAIKSKLDYEKMNIEVQKFFNLPEKEKKKISLNSRKFIIKEYAEESLKEKFIQELFK